MVAAIESFNSRSRGLSVCCGTGVVSIRIQACWLEFVSDQVSDMFQICFRSHASNVDAGHTGDYFLFFFVAEGAINRNWS